MCATCSEVGSESRTVELTELRGTPAARSFSNEYSKGDGTTSISRELTRTILTDCKPSERTVVFSIKEETDETGG